MRKKHAITDLDRKKTALVNTEEANLDTKADVKFH